MLRIRDIMVHDVKTINGDESVSSAASIMSSFNIGSLIVLEGDRPIGIITERDILKKVVATCRDPRNTKVHEIMSKPLITGDPDMDLEYAAKYMVNKDIKRLPIVERGRLVGIVTFTDIVRAQPHVVEALERALTAATLPKRFEKILRKRILKT
jgi:CBS domain-containing protein